jgi:hypothetical protein
MDASFFIMWGGFILAAYSVVGNDVIQTLGTFLSSNEKRPWWVLWIFAASILTATLLYSWYNFDGDVSYQRLIGDAPYTMENPKYPLPDPFSWFYILPPLVLMFVTRLGIPVSTSFLILTFFKPKGLDSMLVKSVSGYLLAFVAALVIYFIISKTLEKRFVERPIKDREQQVWTVLQWFSTGFLWTQWLAQDFANIYVYLPRRLDAVSMFVSLLILVSLLAYIFWQRGGAIQKIVRAKSNTGDIRSATIIDFIYGIILFFFKELNNVPMSTTWVFIGLLGGREIAMRFMLGRESGDQNFERLLDDSGQPTGRPSLVKDLMSDLGKVFLGLVISLVLVFFIQWVQGQDVLQTISDLFNSLTGAS